MINQELLKSSIESLKMIQSELHDDIDSSERIELGRIIKELESCNTNITPRQLLIIVDKVISWIPAVERLVKILLELGQ
ncbi:hypothetical protein [Psychromonas arctica]|uniref:hypothetical protein n=1 Tax=Psychromonas arctica TaxID=168275 RepID=UPI0004083589|nr:hypothetical protein [Psychromonas arctica]